MQVFIIIIAIFFFQVNNFAEIGANFQNTIDKPMKILYNNLVFYFAMLKISQIHSCELTRRCGKGNARLSNEQLAVMLGVTPEEVAARIADYEKRGVIKGYSVILNEELADKNAVTAFIEVKVTPKADFGFDELARTIMMYDEVDSVTLMSGSFDLAVTLSGTNYKEIALFVAKRLSSIDGVISTSTHFVLKQYKEQGFFIENEAADERGFVSP